MFFYLFADLILSLEITLSYDSIGSKNVYMVVLLLRAMTCCFVAKKMFLLLFWGNGCIRSLNNGFMYRIS